MNNVRDAFRQLVRRPGFAGVAVLTLALGIGATAALFTVVHSVVLSPLPYEAPGELVALDSPVPRLAPDAVWGLSEAGYHFFRAESRTLAEIGAYGTSELNLSGQRGASRVRAASVSKSLFDVLRARPEHGRLFIEGDDRPGGPSVIMLGYDFWQREFGADPDIVGSIVEIQTFPREVVGVMAQGFHLPDRPVDVWLPLVLDPLRDPVNAHWLSAIGRLSPGSGVVDAQADLARLTERLPEVFPQAYYPGFIDNYGFTTRARTLREQVLGDVARVLWILLASVGLVLVIAAVNVGNLFMVRTEGRRRELAVRTALGAGRVALLRHGLAEGLVLALLAGALGLFLADLGVRLLLALSPPGLPRLREVVLGWGAVGFTGVVSLAAGAAVGLLPLLRARVDFLALRDASGAASDPGQHTVRRVLVAAQVAMALVLLVAAGLMLRSLERLRAVQPGIDPENAVTFQMSLPAARYQSYADVLAYYHQLVERVEAMPGVRTAGAGPVPFQEFGGCALVFVEDQPVAADERPRCLPVMIASPGYFDALGIPLRGRAPSWGEMESGEAGAVVTAALARRIWPNEDPIGKGIRGNGWEPPFYRVVAVTGELRANGLDEPPVEAVFFPMVPMAGAPLWSPQRSLTLIVRSEGGPERLTPLVRRILSELDRAIPLGDVRTMNQVMEQSMARRSFAMLLLGIAGLMALVLSVVGLYGVVAYVVSRRTGELGVRIALGAPTRLVAGLVVRDALILGTAGAAAGLVVALVVTRVLRSLLFEVSATDGLTLAGATLLLLLVTALASLIPAWRASRINPLAALRAE